MRATILVVIAVVAMGTVASGSSITPRSPRPTPRRGAR
jgi:hypothetical protein